METLFEYADKMAAQAGPQPDEIVLRRLGFTNSIGGMIPGAGYATIYEAHDGRWLATLKYQSGEGDCDFWRAAEYAQTLNGAVQALYELAAEQNAPGFSISRAVEGYCYPIREGDWYKAAALYDRRGFAITHSGELIAQFENEQLESLSSRWDEQVKRVNIEYQKPHVHRIHDDPESWAVWLLGVYMVKGGAPFEWRQSIMTPQP